MGKTYRNVKGAYRANGDRNYDRRVTQPEKITVDWAMKKTKQRIEHVLNELVCQEVIDPSEVEDYFWIITERVAEAVGKYDPDRRNTDGRTASAMNYLFTTIDNTVANIVERSSRQLRDGEEVPISKLPPDEAKDLGFISENDMRFSDGCKSIRMLELRMDTHTLVGMLTPDELRVLQYRIMGYTVNELCKMLCVSRMHVIRRIIPSIQRKARFCGFFPSEEIRKGA